MYWKAYRRLDEASGYPTWRYSMGDGGAPWQPVDQRKLHEKLREHWNLLSLDGRTCTSRSLTRTAVNCVEELKPMFKAMLGQIDPRLVPTDIPSLSKVVNALIVAGKFEPPADRARNRHSLGSTGTTPDRRGVQRSRTANADPSESSGSGSGEASSESEASTPVPGERLMPPPPPSAPFTPTRAPRRFKETTAKELGGSATDDSRSPGSQGSRRESC